MRLQLAPCAHESAIPTSGGRVWTCTSCYRRLRRVRFQPTPDHWTDAPDPPPCAHTGDKHTLAMPRTGKSEPPFVDAICKDCGCAVRHPDGPGEWTNVLTYAPIIHEQP